MVDWNSNLVWLVLALLFKVAHFVAISLVAYRKARKDVRSKYTVFQQGESEAGKQKLVVTGAGYLARNIVDLLVERFSDLFNITVLQLHPPTHKLHPKVTYIVGDVRVPAHVQNALAGAVGVIHTEDEQGQAASAIPATTKDVLVDGTRHIVEVCLDKEVKALVFTSTVLVHQSAQPSIGAGEVRVKEDTPPPDPATLLSPYAAAKRSAERLVLAANGHVVRTAVLRLGWLIGAGDQDVVDRALHSSLAFSASNSKPAFCWVRDAARAHVLALLRLVMPENQAASAAAAQPWTHLTGAVEAQEPDPDYVVVAHTDARVAGRAYHLCFEPDQQPSFAVVAGVAAEGGVNVWGMRPRWCLPHVLLQLLIALNEALARRLGVAPVDEQLTQLHVLLSQRDAAYDISGAKDVLGWRPLPWAAAKDAIQAEALPPSQAAARVKKES